MHKAHNFEYNKEMKETLYYISIRLCQRINIRKIKIIYPYHHNTNIHLGSLQIFNHMSSSIEIATIIAFFVLNIHNSTYFMTLYRYRFMQSFRTITTLFELMTPVN